MLDEVVRAVAARDPVDDRERRSIERFLKEVERLARPFDEDADPVHITASAIVVGPRGVLLHLHKILGRWLQPGGHVDPGETPWEAARREAYEETGVEVVHSRDVPELLHVDVHPAAHGHTHLDLRYLLTAGDVDPAPPPGESQEVCWFEWAEADAVADEALRGALVAIRSRPRG